MISKRLLAKTLREGWKGINSPMKEGDCGYDLFASEDIIIPPKSAPPTSIPTETCVKIPKGYWGQVITRSGANRRGLLALSGVIDEGYTGQLFAIVYNMNNDPVEVKKGERIAQIVLHKRFTPQIKWIDTLPKTERGTSGFGSTN